jgi:hypothetical protein
MCQTNLSAARAKSLRPSHFTWHFCSETEELGLTRFFGLERD